MNQGLSVAAPVFAGQASAAAALSAPAPLATLRREGAEAFARLGFPTTRNEDWHYTSVSQIAEGEFTAAVDGRASSLDAEALGPYTFGGQWPLVVFVNGRFAPSLSSLDALPDGVRVMSLA